MLTLNGVGDIGELMLAHLDDIGTPAPTTTTLSAGRMPWTALPVDEADRLALGRHAPAWPRWSAGFQATGEVRHQFHHVIDIVPTILECAGLPEPDVVNGVTQKPIEGVSMAYTFDDPAAPERRTTQYFEMFGNRGIYHNGWSAVTRHSNLFGPVSQDWSEDVGIVRRQHRLEPGARPRRRDAGKAGRTAATLPD